jgi:hypothetical protein
MTADAALTSARIVAWFAVFAVAALIILGATWYGLSAGEAALIALLLAFVPYLILRGPIARVAHWWRQPASGAVP